LAGNPGMPGERGSVIIDRSLRMFELGEKGPKGFAGREGDMGSNGYISALLYNY